MAEPGPGAWAWAGSIAEPGRPEVFVHLLPALIPAGALVGGTALVLDVLRATTVIVQALAMGCKAVIPCATIDEATAVAARVTDGPCLLGGERDGLPIAGFDLGNSPGDFTAESRRGATLVLTTTNGTHAILASRSAEAVGIAANTNATAAVAWAAWANRPVHIVAAGTDGHVSLEDTLLAGKLAHGLVATRGYTLANDAAVVAVAVARQADAALASGVSWLDLLALGRGGRRVRAIGRDADIAAAARWATVDLVPVLVEAAGGPRLVRATSDSVSVSSTSSPRRA